MKENLSYVHAMVSRKLRMAQFPDYEKFAMVSQLIRAATSIPANIAEGNSQCFIKREFSFLNIALGSASELRCWIELAHRQSYINKEIFDKLEEQIKEVIRLIIGCMKKLKREM
ncbi:four helix bundle protein [Desulfofalx alkaliphila]|uniref:four helix bundle protein n=1 Tax=Desulfofalx alkaliphila TaxID=105483 RepID=UPI0004E1651E|nr:four helix bundle protein [Desulfofalx alkaliphila]